jgi:CHASE2 domain-containing sensor protein
MLQAIRRECPECRVTLTRYEWSRLWWVSSGLSGRLVQPCAECGTVLRLSSMHLISILGALGLIGASVALFILGWPALLVAALVFAILMLAGVLGTRVERAEKLKVTDQVAVPSLDRPPPS